MKVLALGYVGYESSTRSARTSATINSSTPGVGSTVKVTAG